MFHVKQGESGSEERAFCRDTRATWISIWALLDLANERHASRSRDELLTQFSQPTLRPSGRLSIRPPIGFWWFRNDQVAARTKEPSATFEHHRWPTEAARHDKRKTSSKCSARCLLSPSFNDTNPSFKPQFAYCTTEKLAPALAAVE